MSFNLGQRVMTEDGIGKVLRYVMRAPARGSPRVEKVRVQLTDGRIRHYSECDLSIHWKKSEPTKYYISYEVNDDDNGIKEPLRDFTVTKETPKQFENRMSLIWDTVTILSHHIVEEK